MSRTFPELCPERLKSAREKNDGPGLHSYRPHIRDISKVDIPYADLKRSIQQGKYICEKCP